LIAQHRAVAALARRYGGAFTINLPIFAQTEVISDPTHAKNLFSTSRNLLGRAKNNLGEMIGPGSLFNLEGD
jgi:shikimate kinase